MMSVKQAADRLGISPTTLYALCARGALPHHRPTPGGRKIVLDERDVEQYLEDCRRGARPQPRAKLRYLHY